MTANSDREQSLDLGAFRAELTAAIPHMRAFARSLTGDAATADDLSQDALVKAWAARDSFRAGTNFRAWVFTIVRNQFYSDRRKAWRQVEWDQERAEQHIANSDNPLDTLALDDLRRAMRQLPDDQREAIILVGAGGFSYAEAAEICGCAIGTVKSRVSRARTVLAEILESGPDMKAGADGVDPANAIDSLLRDVETLAGPR